MNGAESELIGIPNVKLLSGIKPEGLVSNSNITVT